MKKYRAAIKSFMAVGLAAVMALQPISARGSQDQTPQVQTEYEAEQPALVIDAEEVFVEAAGKVFTENFVYSNWPVGVQPVVFCSCLPENAGRLFASVRFTDEQEADGTGIIAYYLDPDTAAGDEYLLEAGYFNENGEFVLCDGFYVLVESVAEELPEADALVLENEEPLIVRAGQDAAVLDYSCFGVDASRIGTVSSVRGLSACACEYEADEEGADGSDYFEVSAEETVPAGHYEVIVYDTDTLCVLGSFETVVDGMIELSNAVSDQSGIGWKWDNEQKTLTLTDCEINTAGGAYHIAVVLPADTTVKLAGENTVTNTYADGDKYIIYCFGALTFVGEDGAKLTVSNRDTAANGTLAAIRADGPLTFRDCEVTVDGSAAEGSVYENCYAISGQAVAIKNSTVSAASGAANGTACGIMSETDIAITKSTVDAVGGSVSGDAGISCGIACLDAHTVNVWDSVVNMIGGEAETENGQSCGLIGNLQVMSGTVTAKTLTENGCVQAAVTSGVLMTDGEVKLSGDPEGTDAVEDFVRDYSAGEVVDCRYVNVFFLTAEEKADAAKAALGSAVQEALVSIELTDDTTADRVQEAVEEAVRSVELYRGVTVTVEEFQKSDPAGRIDGSIKITVGSGDDAFTDSIAVTLNTKKLSEDGQETDEEELPEADAEGEPGTDTGEVLEDNRDSESVLTGMGEAGKIDGSGIVAMNTDSSVNPVQSAKSGADKVADAKAVVENIIKSTFVNYIVGSDSTTDSVRSALEEAIRKAAISSDVTVAVGDITRNDATDLTAGSIVGVVNISSFSEEKIAVDSVPFSLTISEVTKTDAEKVAEAKTAIGSTVIDVLSGITVNNSTSVSSVEKALTDAVRALNISTVLVEMSELQKTEATKDATGSITGYIVISSGTGESKVSDTLEIYLSIAQLGDSVSNKKAEGLIVIEGNTQDEKASAENVSVKTVTYDETKLIAIAKTAEGITQDEIAALELGTAKADIRLKVNDSAQIPENDKTAAEGMKVQNKVLQGLQYFYMDISMAVQVKGFDERRITDSDSEFTIVLEIPEKLQNLKGDYHVIRVHDGKPEILTSLYNALDHTLTFKTGKFSTYAVAYKSTGSSTGDGISDKTLTGVTRPVTTIGSLSTVRPITSISTLSVSGGDVSGGDVSGGNAGRKLDKVPKTGEQNDLYLWIVLAAAAGASAFRMRRPRDIEG